VPTENASQLKDLSPRDVQDLLRTKKAVLIDVREPDEFVGERISGALLMPLSFLDPDEFPAFTGTQVILMCGLGGRSTKAAKALINAGFGTIQQLQGGLKAWKDEGLPTDMG